MTTPSPPQHAAEAPAPSAPLDAQAASEAAFETDAATDAATDAEALKQRRWLELTPEEIEEAMPPEPPPFEPEIPKDGGDV